MAVKEWLHYLLSDSLVEREALFDRVYFRLQASSLECGYELQVLDGGWGACANNLDLVFRRLLREAQSQWFKEDPALIVTVNGGYLEVYTPIKDV